MTSMMSIAVLVGFGVTGVMFYMFTADSLKQYAVIKTLGGTPRLLLAMIAVQVGSCAIVGTGIGLGLCAAVGRVTAAQWDYPFRMMWFTPLLGVSMVLLISVVAAAISARPLFRLEPGVVFAGR